MILNCIDTAILVAARLFLGELSSILLTFVLALGSCVTLGFFIKKQHIQQTTSRPLIVFSLLGVCGVFLANFFYFESLKYTTAGNTALIYATSPLLTLFLDSVLRRQRPNFQVTLAFAVAFLGIACISAQDVEFTISSMDHIGELFAFLSAFMWACYALILERITGNFSPTFINFTANIMGSLCLLPIAMSLFPPLSSISWIQWLSILFIGIVGGGVDYILYTKCVRSIGSSLTTLFVDSLHPICALFVGNALFAESIHMGHIFGSGIIILGLSLVPQE